VILALLKLNETRVNPHGERLDLPGAITLPVSLATFLAALTFGPSYGWNSITIISMLSIAAATLTLFALLEVRFARHPILELSLFTKNRMFAAANAAALFSYVAIIGVTFVMSIYLQDVLGFAPQTAGIFLIVTSTAMALLAPVSGWLSDRLGSRLLTTVGMAIVTIGLLLLSQLSVSSSTQEILLRLVLVGFGFGLFTSPNTSAVMGSVSRAKLGVAAGTLGMMRFMGQSIGLALAGAVIALAIPPREMLALFAGLVTQDTVAGDAFIVGMRDFFLLSSLIAGLGTLSSMVRGRESRPETHQNSDRGMSQ
jgi:nitrate/nitrite transporter NarK